MKNMLGRKVRANDFSDYEGLVGEIVEIREGEEKETDNDGVDFYVAFEIPKNEELIRKIEKTFSILYDEELSLDDIALDGVIMSKDMLEFI